MTDEKKTRNDQQSSPEEHHEERGTPEKLWDATVKTWSSATFRASQYRRVVQKKIDVTAIHKKIATAHTDLGKMIDDLHQEGKDDPMADDRAQQLLQKLDSLRSAAATLEEEIVAIKAEEPELDLEEHQEQGPTEH